MNLDSRIRPLRVHPRMYGEPWDAGSFTTSSGVGVRRGISAGLINGYPHGDVGMDKSGFRRADSGRPASHDVHEYVDRLAADFGLIPTALKWHFTAIIENNFHDYAPH